MAGDHDHLGVGRDCQHVLQDGETLAHTAGVGRQPQVQRHDGGTQPLDLREGRLAVLRDCHFQPFEAPAQLALQPRVVLDHQQSLRSLAHVFDPML